MDNLNPTPTNSYSGISQPSNNLPNQSSSSAAIQALSWQSSARRRRLRSLRMLKPQPIKIGLVVLAALTNFAGLIMLLFSQRIGALWFVVGLPLAMLAFYRVWGLDQFLGDWIEKRSITNIPDLLSSELVVGVNRRSDANQIWQASLGTWQAAYLANHFEIPETLLQTVQSKISSLSSDQLYGAAGQMMIKSQAKFISGATILVAGMSSTNTTQPGLLDSFEISETDLITGLTWLNKIENRQLEHHHRQSLGGIGRDFAAGYTNYLDQFATNISEQIEAGQTGFSAFGREELISQMVQLLNQPTRTNVALIGPTGIGKSNLLFRFAEQMLAGSRGGRLTYRKVMSISATAIDSVGSKEPVEAIFQKMIDDAIRAKNVILFFEDAALFFEQKPGAMDASRILLPILDKTNLPIVFSFTDDEWTHFAQIKPQLIGMMNKLTMPEVTDDMAFHILLDVAYDFENQHRIVITYKALKEAIKLSDRFLSEKAQPGRAIDVLLSSLNYPDQQRITEKSVQLAVEQRTGVKAGTVEQGSAEAQNLLQLEDLIHKRMINQNSAVKAVSSALRRARTGVRNPKRPIGSFLFLGPTGVGKTELARSLAAVYFGDEANMIRLDMSEFQTPADITRLLSAAQESSTGSSFLQQVRMKPSSVVLLDEIEKAHPDFLNLLLQLLDEGRLTDTSGKTVSFKECIIITTSNAGAEQIRAWVDQKVELITKHDELIDLLISKQIFKPELLNRYDDIVMFRPLTPAELQQVVGIMLELVNLQLANRHIRVEMTEPAKAFMVSRGNDPRMGARPMQRALQRFVENVIAQRLLGGQLKPGTTVVITPEELAKVETEV